MREGFLSIWTNMAPKGDRKLSAFRELRKSVGPEYREWGRV